jgi:hypothetical protein
MMLTYDQIIRITHEIMDKVKMAGHRLDRCVWELNPLIYMVLSHANQHTKPYGIVRPTLYGIPVRLCYEVSGIMLKMVNQNPQE